jgi:hypothetical protein
MRQRKEATRLDAAQFDAARSAAVENMVEWLRPYMVRDSDSNIATRAASIFDETIELLCELHMMRALEEFH